jgi:hypothetical protein
MNKTITRIMLGFVAVFVVGTACLLVYQTLWLTPAKKCEEMGNWWDPETRICATPISIDKITRRPLGSPPIAAPRPQAAAAEANAVR